MKKCFICSCSHSDLFVVKLLQLGQRLNPLLPHTLLRVGQDVWMHLQQSRVGWGGWGVNAEEVLMTQWLQL